jgi:hypothetical protein
MPQPWAQAELAGARVWDPRCRRSLIRICEQLADRPQASFSTACGPAVRQAAHRIFEHATTSVADLLHGHSQQTARRCQEALGPLSPATEPSLLLVAQDTTELDYSTYRATAGLGQVGRGAAHRGLLAHAALAMTVAGRPLGLLHLELWARDPAALGQREERMRRPTRAKESQKWLTGLAAIEAALPPTQPVLVIQDRKADLYDLLAAPRRAPTQLLIRACQPRVVAVTTGENEADGCQTLFAAVAAAAVCGILTVAVPRQAGQPEREAVLTLRTRSVAVPPPSYRPAAERRDPARTVTVWAIEARESEPPPGSPPIHWVLLSTRPAPDGESAVWLVRVYTRRWRIERLHFVLKAGLRVERLQWDDATSLQHALALYYLVAWRLLWLTESARAEPERPAAALLSAAEQALLAAHEGRPVQTQREAVQAIARLGGFPRAPAAGEPGVKSLWLGLTRLEAMVLGWKLAHHAHATTIQD